MYVKCLIAAISLVTMPAIAAEQTTPLLPEVAKVFEITIDEQTIDNNAYVALRGLEAPIGLDYKAIGKAYTLAQIKQKQQATQQIKRLPSIKISAFYQGKQAINDIDRESVAKVGFPCYNLVNLHCVKESLAKQTELQKALAQNIPQNKVLLERYQQILELPNYDTYDISIAATPAYEIKFLQQIRLLQAIELIDKGNVEQGLGILQQEIDFSKRILQTKHTWLEYSSGIIRLSDAYHVVSELLDSSKLANHLTDPKLLALLKPLTIQEQQTILINHLTSFRDLEMRDLYFKNEQFVKQEFEEYADKELKDYVKKHNIPIKFDSNMAINKLYKSYQPMIEKVTKAVPEAIEIEQSLQPDVNGIAYYDNIYKKYGADNFITALNGARDIKSFHLGYKQYNLQSYLTLINVKLQIKQAAISKDKVPAFLVKLEEQTKNPYIKQPFYWDAEKQILAVDWFKNYLHDKEWAGDKAEVYIDFAQ